MLILHYNYFNVWVYRTCLIVSLCFANVLCHSEERSDVRIAGNGHLVKECGYPSGRLPQHRKAVLRNDIKCFARSGISVAISQYHTATNPYFVNTSYASFLTSQSSQATIACLMLAYSFSPKVRKYLLGSPIFPTGTKVSRGVPDFNDISYSEWYEK